MVGFLLFSRLFYSFPFITRRVAFSHTLVIKTRGTSILVDVLLSRCRANSLFQVSVKNFLLPVICSVENYIGFSIALFQILPCIFLHCICTDIHDLSGPYKISSNKESFRCTFYSEITRFF